MEALIAAHLTETLAAELVTQIEKITFWSSSYKAFVGNRLSEIHTIMSNPETALGAGAFSWRYVPTGDNPADDITRGLHSVELNVNHHYMALGRSSFTKQPSSRQKTKLKWPWKTTKEKGNS